MRKLTDFERQRLEEQRNHFQSEWNIRTAKLAELRKALAIETSVVNKFQLDHQIQAEKEEITRLENQLSQLEQNLNRGTTSSSVPQRSSQSRSSANLNSSKGSSTAQQSSQLRSRSVDPDRIIAVLPRIRVWLFAIVTCWTILGRVINADDLPMSLPIGAGFGGGLTGLFYGLAKQKLVPSTQWDQIILTSMIGAGVGIAVGLLVGIGNPSALFRDGGIGIGIGIGCVIALVTLWKLSLYSQRRY
jgi:hypothetical protein